MNKQRSLKYSSTTSFYFLGTHNASPKLADAFWLVGRLSHGDNVVPPAEETVDFINDYPKMAVSLGKIISRSEVYLKKIKNTDVNENRYKHGKIVAEVVSLVTPVVISKVGKLRAIEEISVDVERNLVKFEKELARLLASKKITTTEELIAYLDEITESTTVVQLEERGIKSFFRGTTRSKKTNGLFAGSTNAQIGGMSASTDPVKSTIFAIESETQFGGTKGVLQMGLPSDLKNISLSAPNRRVSIELEVVFNTSAENFAVASKAELSVENARKAIKEVFRIDLPSSLSRDEATHLLSTLPASSLEKSLEFYQKALKYNTK